MTVSEYFSNKPRVALGFSGGVDSACLLYLALMNHADVKPYFVRTGFQTEEELTAARSFCDNLGVKLEILNCDVLNNADITQNSSKRCYFCKKQIFTTIKAAAENENRTVIEGTNASDDIDDRPGYHALSELCVESPLKSCGLTKQNIRDILKKAGFEIWNKPSSACLATRIQQGSLITKDKLLRAYNAEKFLSTLGFSDFRVRILGENARIQIKGEQLAILIENRASILSELKKSFDGVLLDLEVR